MERIVVIQRVMSNILIHPHSIEVTIEMLQASHFGKVFNMIQIDFDAWRFLLSLNCLVCMTHSIILLDLSELWFSYTAAFAVCCVWCVYVSSLKACECLWTLYEYSDMNSEMKAPGCQSWLEDSVYGFWAASLWCNTRLSFISASSSKLGGFHIPREACLKVIFPKLWVSFVCFCDRLYSGLKFMHRAWSWLCLHLHAMLFAAAFLLYHNVSHHFGSCFLPSDASYDSSADKGTHSAKTDNRKRKELKKKELGTSLSVLMFSM